MSSLWSNAASPFAAQGTAPSPGGGAAARFQSILQSAGQSRPSSAQPGLSPAASRAAATSASGGARSAAASGSSSTSDADATISANDFLTLLVTEMQNQDPTADVDPNAYIDQLVQINSLEQLISINQNLETVLGAATHPTSSATTAGSGAGVPAARTVGPAAPAVGAHGRQVSPAAAVTAARGTTQPAAVHGNLGAPGAAPAAKTVAHALDGRARRGGHAIRDIPTRALP